jgi:hypothetical protein
MELVKRGDEERKEGESSDLRFQEMENSEMNECSSPFKPLYSNDNSHYALLLTTN